MFPLGAGGFGQVSAGGATGNERSVRLRAAASAYFSRTFGTPTNAKKWTLSVWMKHTIKSGYPRIFERGAGGYIRFDTGSHALYMNDATAGATVQTTAVYRDPAAWYHLVVAVDTTQATDTNRWKVYMNGVQETSFTGTIWPSLNNDCGFNAAVAHYFGGATASQHFDGYFADGCFVDGTAYTPSQFGETNANGIWVPLTPTEIIGSTTFGNNGFFLDFRDVATTAGSNAGLGKDTSGNGNYWTTNNISVTSGVTYDSMYDYPLNATSATQPIGNYATLNPLGETLLSTLSNGALKMSGSSAAYKRGLATIAIPSATKIYFEAIPTGSNPSNSSPAYFGVANSTWTTASSGTGLQCFRLQTALDIRNESSLVATVSGSATTSSVIQGAVDLANSKIWFGMDNTYYKADGSSGASPSAGTDATITSPLSGTLFPAFGRYENAAGDGWDVNFGQRPFAYTPPTGFKALCTANLPTPAIADPSDYFDVKTRTGTGASYSVSGLGFSPDLVWIKSRSDATASAVYDSVRGAQQDLVTSTTADETTQSTGVTAFNADGYSGGALAKINTNTSTYVDTFWEEAITSGVDIVSYTGNGSARTINHSLGVVPAMMIVKARVTAGTDMGWAVYHSGLTDANYYTTMNTTLVQTSDSTVWNGTAPTNSVFSVGTHALTNTNSDTYIAYLFAEISGFSKFGTYTGNGAADGPFVYCGFQPKFVMIKSRTSALNWPISDTERSTYNVSEATWYTNSVGAENTSGNAIDIVSNGFKVRNLNTQQNQASDVYIFAAFAEFPFASNNRAR